MPRIKIKCRKRKRPLDYRIKEGLKVFLCKIGIHKKEARVIIGCNYEVCERCCAGHPMVTGEF